MSRLKRDLLLLGLALILAGVAVILVTPRALAIDEVIDNYQNTDRVNVTVNVVHNSTLDVMELDFTRDGLRPPMDIWTTGGFTEVDPGGDNLKNINGTHIWFDSVDRDEGDRIYKDFGANYFDGNWTYYFRVKISSFRISNARCLFMVFSETSEDQTDMIANDRDWLSFHIQWLDLTSEWRLQLRSWDEGDFTSDSETSNGALDLDKWYHVTLTRYGDNTTAWFYNDALKTDLDFMLTVTDPDVTDLRYFHPLNSQDLASGGRAMDLNLNRVQNFTATGEYELSGYFTTTNFMIGLSESITVVLLNYSIPEGSINL